MGHPGSDEYTDQLDGIFIVWFSEDPQTEREMCIEANVCIQNQELHPKMFTHKFFTLFHSYQFNDNVNMKQILRTGFSFVKKLLC